MSVVVLPQISSIQSDSNLGENKPKAFVHSILECLFGGHLQLDIDRCSLSRCMDIVMKEPSLSKSNNCIGFATYVKQFLECNSTESFR